MSLKDYSPPRKDIAAGSVTLSVRGLNLDDVALLMGAHAEKMIGSFFAFEKMAKDSPTADALMAKSIMTLVFEAPAVAADIIALACDEPDSAPEARKLPFPAQVTALTEVGRLTFEASGGLGNFLAALKGIGAGLGIQMPDPMERLRPSVPPISGDGKPSSPETVS